MKFIVVTQAFKAVGILRPNQLPKPKECAATDPDIVQCVDSGAALQSDTSADGVEFEFDAGNTHAASHFHAQIHCAFNQYYVTFPILVLHIFVTPPSAHTPQLQLQKGS